MCWELLCPVALWVLTRSTQVKEAIGGFHCGNRRDLKDREGHLSILVT